MISMSRLDNGLIVVTEAMAHVDTVSLGVWVDAGSRHEEAGDHGVAHFLEHMAFKGTQRRSARKIAEEMECVGGELNAATSHENTAYYARVLKEHVGLAVDILGDVLINSVFDPQELERERQVILQEIAAVHDTPDDVVFDLFLEAAYPVQPLGRCILGTPETVGNCNPDRLRHYLRANYHGSSMVLCAAGAVDHNEILDLANLYMGALPAGRAGTVTRAIYRGGERRLERDLEQVQFILGVSAPSYHDKDFYAIRLLAGLLGGGMSSRLFQEVRELRGLCYSVSAFHWPYRDTGIFGVHAATGAHALEELTEVVTREMRRVALDASEEELMRVRQQVRAGLLMGLESSSVRAERMAGQMMLFGEVISVDEMLLNFEKVTTERVRILAEELFSNPSPTIAAVGPLTQLHDYECIVRQLS